MMSSGLFHISYSLIILWKGVFKVGYSNCFSVCLFALDLPGERVTSRFVELTKLSKAVSMPLKLPMSIKGDCAQIPGLLML